MLFIKSIYNILMFLLLIIVFNSCSYNPIDYKIKLVAVTNNMEYGVNEEITYSIINYSDSPAYVRFCGGYAFNWIEKKTSEDWEIYFMPQIPAICGPTFKKLITGDYLKWEISLIDEVGKYRIVIPVNNDGVITNEDNVFTNEFIIK